MFSLPLKMHCLFARKFEVPGVTDKMKMQCLSKFAIKSACFLSLRIGANVYVSLISRARGEGTCLLSIIFERKQCTRVMFTRAVAHLKNAQNGPQSFDAWAMVIQSFVICVAGTSKRWRFFPVRLYVEAPLFVGSRGTQLTCCLMVHGWDFCNVWISGLNALWSPSFKYCVLKGAAGLSV